MYNLNNKRKIKIMWEIMEGEIMKGLGLLQRKKKNVSPKPI